MNRHFTYIGSIVILALACFSCRDTASTGFLCNFTGSETTFVMGPLDTLVYSQQIDRGSVTVIDFNPSNQRAVLEVSNDECLWIANGTNGLRTSNLFIDYLEMRLPTETRIYNSREEIFDLFVEVQNEVYEIQVRQ
jgi:hypothetical protein